MWADGDGEVTSDLEAPGWLLYEVVLLLSDWGGGGGWGSQGGGRADSGSDERPEPEVLGTGLAETTEPVGDLQPKLGPLGYFSPSKPDTIRG